MANHLTPEELSKELGIDRQEVIRVCVEEGVPIYQGKIAFPRNPFSVSGSKGLRPTYAPAGASKHRSSPPPSSSARLPPSCGPSRRRRCA